MRIEKLDSTTFILIVDKDSVRTSKDFLELEGRIGEDESAVEVCQFDLREELEKNWDK